MNYYNVIPFYLYIIIFASISLSDPSLLSSEILIKNFNLFVPDNLGSLDEAGGAISNQSCGTDSFLAPQHWSTKVPNVAEVSGQRPRNDESEALFYIL